MPSRLASCVATVDLPTPVTPPSRTSSGRSSRRGATTGGSASSPARPPRRAAPPRPARAARSTLTSPGALVDEPLLDLPRERERALGRQPGGHDRLRHQPLRVWKAVVAADTTTRRCGGPRLMPAPAPPRARASRSERVVEVGSPASGTGRLRRNTIRAPPAPRALGDDLDRRRLELGQVDVAALARASSRSCSSWRAAGEVRRDDARSTPLRASASRSAAPRSGRAVVNTATRAPGAPAPPARARARRRDRIVRRSTRPAGRPAPRAPPAPSSSAPNTTSRSRAQQPVGTEVARAPRRGARRRWSTQTVRSAATGGSAAPLPSSSTSRGPRAQRQPHALDDVRVEHLARRPLAAAPAADAVDAGQHGVLEVVRGGVPARRARSPAGAPRRAAPRRARAAARPARPAHRDDHRLGPRRAAARRSGRRPRSCRSACRCRSPRPPGTSVSSRSAGGGVSRNPARGTRARGRARRRRAATAPPPSSTGSPDRSITASAAQSPASSRSAGADAAGRDLTSPP